MGVFHSSLPSPTNLCQIIHFLTLTYNSTNQNKFHNHGLEVEVATKDIKKEDSLNSELPALTIEHWWKWF